MTLTPDLRAKIVYAAQWCVARHAEFTYSEGADRMTFEHRPPFTLPVITDCSGFVTLCYKWAGAPDPNGLGYDGYGYTGTLLKHMKHITRGSVQPGDVIVYGPGTGHHAVVVVHVDPSWIKVASHGQQGDPSILTNQQVANGQPPGIAFLTLP